METPIQVRLYGALRKYGNGSEISMSIEQPCSIPTLREKLSARLAELHPDFSDSALIQDCAFGSESEIWNDEDQIENRAWIAALPPVCGG